MRNPAVLKLLLYRASEFAQRPTPEELAESLRGERFPYPKDPILYRGLVAFRHLRSDARIAAARRALESA